jgi:two-component system sensor histidine kinase HydH
MKWWSKVYVRYIAILSLILLISVFHHKTSTEYRYLHEIYQRAYYIPILLAAYWYGPLRGIIAAFLAH